MENRKRIIIVLILLSLVSLFLPYKVSGENSKSMIAPQVYIENSNLVYITFPSANEKVYLTSDTDKYIFYVNAVIKIKHLNSSQLSYFEKNNNKEVLMAYANTISSSNSKVRWDQTYGAEVEVTLYFDQYIKSYWAGKNYFTDPIKTEARIIYLDGTYQTQSINILEECFGKAYSSPNRSSYIGTKSHSQEITYYFPSLGVSYWLYDNESCYYDIKPSGAFVRSTATFYFKRGNSTWHFSVRVAASRNDYISQSSNMYGKHR